MTTAVALAEEEVAVVPENEDREADDRVASQLRATHLFGDLDQQQISALAAACNQARIPAGEVFIKEGDPGDHMYLVVSGRLRVTQKSEYGDVVLGEVREGEHFGEIALLGRTPRMATVTAVTACELIALSRDTLQKFIAQNPKLSETLTSGLIYRLNWAKTRRHRPSPEALSKHLAEIVSVEPSKLAGLEAETQWQPLPRGTVLMREGEKGDCLYFVLAGRLRAYTKNEDGSEIDLGEIGPGESVGEMALLGNALRSAYVVTERDSELLRLSQAGFDRLVAEHPQTMVIFTKVLMDRLNRRIRQRGVVTQVRSSGVVSVEECEDITKTENLVLRNLKITQMYHRLSLQLTTLLGHEDANWCTFACNASKTAGYSIRREELPFYGAILMLKQNRHAAALLDKAEQTFASSWAMKKVETILQGVSDAISAGNLKVFAELAPIFARFVRTFHSDSEYSREKLNAFLDTMKSGATEAGGQDTLKEALAHYYEATFEPNMKRKTELILLGNIKVGLHEQMRLQPNIIDALNTPLALGLAELPKHRLIVKALEKVTVLWRRLATQSLMTLRLPYGVLRLGSEIPNLPNARIYADMLQSLDNQELARIVKHFSRAHSGFADWGNLDDRMKFIVQLFRSRQKSLELFDQPFFWEQRVEMAGNLVPGGRL